MNAQPTDLPEPPTETVEQARAKIRDCFHALDYGTPSDNQEMALTLKAVSVKQAHVSR